MIKKAHPPQSQSGLLVEYFIKNPRREIAHPEIVDWATAEWKRRTNTVFRDPDRAIRKLHQDGFLIKVKKGVYKYDPDAVKNKELEDFTSEQKAEILKRDNYRCVVCGRGVKDGVELHVDHIRSKDDGGKAEIDNGETLCAQHNFQKKNYKQTESGKRFFIRLYRLAKKNGDKKMQDFCRQILQVYENNNMNGHILWEK